MRIGRWTLAGLILCLFLLFGGCRQIDDETGGKQAKQSITEENQTEDKQEKQAEQKFTEVNEPEDKQEKQAEEKQKKEEEEQTGGRQSKQPEPESADADAVSAIEYTIRDLGPWWDVDIRTGTDPAKTYRNYAQGAYCYGEYSDYVAMHGCALCCTTTVIRAWYPEEDWTPERVLAELEPAANEAACQRNYSKSLGKQMPLSLMGISRVLSIKRIPHSYVKEFDKETVADDLIACLRKGNPIIYEAGNGGYHMLLLLGLLDDGNVMVSDSVGSYRVREATIETVVNQMFSCKEEPASSYFSGRKTAGGYIVVDHE